MNNILIVDDSSVSRLKLYNLLRDNDYNLYEAKNLNAVKNNLFSDNITLNDINLILLDLHLKGESGLDLLDYLNENHSNIPVMMVSGEGKKEKVIETIKSGAKDYLLKPFEEKILLDKITKLL